MTREENIARLERLGVIDPICIQCQEYFYPFLKDRWMPGMSLPVAPSHKLSKHCQSGKRSHCTCDECF